MEPTLFRQPDWSNAAATSNNCHAERPATAPTRRDKSLPVFPADIWVRQATPWCPCPIVTFITPYPTIPDGSAQNAERVYESHYPRQPHSSKLVGSAIKSIYGYPSSGCLCSTASYGSSMSLGYPWFDCASVVQLHVWASNQINLSAPSGPSQHASHYSHSCQL
jgi:hypothetical protein